MGVAIPRPAMRGREERIIHAKLKYMSERRARLVADGVDADEAGRTALAEVRALHKQFLKQDAKDMAARRRSRNSSQSGDI